MTKIEDFRQFLADMDDLNGRLESLAKEASAALADRAALLRRGKTIGLTIAAVDQMLANVRVDYRPPVDADTDPETQQDGCAVATADGAMDGADTDGGQVVIESAKAAALADGPDDGAAALADGRDGELPSTGIVTLATEKDVA